MIVGVDSDAKDFHVHEDALRRHSEFFRAALIGDWNEAREGIVRLPEEDPEVFDTFVTFVYSGRVNVPQDTDCSTDKVDSDELGALADCWLLADRMISQSFKDAVADALTKRIVRTGMVPLDMPEIIYAHTSIPCGIKRLLVDVAVLGWNEGDFRDQSHNTDLVAFLAETTIRALNMTTAEKNGDYSWADMGCKYHDHGDGMPCYKTMFRAEDEKGD